MGSKGRKRVKDCFTLQRTLAGIETVYATILRQPRQMLEQPTSFRTKSRYLHREDN
jgi:hypothetical protein